MKAVIHEAPRDADMTVLTSLGNAGYQVLRGECCVLFDPFFQPVDGIALRKGQTNVILITHDHWDHFSPEAVIRAARDSGATVVAPSSVARKLRGSLPEEQLLELEPPAAGDTRRASVGQVGITAVRTRHGLTHISYLADIAGFRVFDDGDNEHTGCIDRRLLRGLDALLLCPWQGSGWVEFIESVQPRRWFLIHVSDEEIDEHERGAFFRDLCDHVPAGLTVLRPGRSFTILPREKSS